jgi:hypothetical protein
MTRSISSNPTISAISPDISSLGRPEDKTVRREPNNGLTLGILRFRNFHESRALRSLPGLHTVEVEKRCAILILRSSDSGPEQYSRFYPRLAMDREPRSVWLRQTSKN